MPQRRPGIKKETKSTASVASSDINSSDIKSLISAMEDWVSEFRSASKLKSTSKSDAEALNKAVKELSGVIKDSKELEEQREDLLKKSANLSEDQQKRVMEAFDSKVVSQYKKLAKVTDIVDPLALSLTSEKFGKKRAETYSKSLQETVSILKRIDQRAEDRSKKEEIVAQNKKAKDSVSKFGSEAMDTVLNPLFHSLLGPLQLFTDPLEKLFKVDLYQIPKSLAVLRKKTPASRERVLAEGGVFGAGMVLIHDAIAGKKGNGEQKDESSIGSVIETAIGTALGTKSSGLLHGLFSLLKSPTFWGISALGSLVAFTTFSTFTNQMGLVYEKALKDAQNVHENAIDTNKSGTVTIQELDNAINGLIASNRSVASWFDMFETEEDRANARKAIGLTLWDNLNEDTRNRSKDTYDWLMRTSAGVINNPDPSTVVTPIVTPSGGYLVSSDSGLPDGMEGMGGTYYGLPGVEPERIANNMNTMLSDLNRNMTYGTLGDLFAMPSGNYSNLSDDDVFKFMQSAMASNNMELYEDLSKERRWRERMRHLEAQYMNDAVIYKDNEVYIPHPDDNIVLTKSNVTAGGIDEGTLDTIISILSSIDTHTASPSTVTSVVNNVSGQSGTMDFSGLRL